MIQGSPIVNINSNRKHIPMRISEFLSDLSMMEDDSEKIMKLGDFICSLEDEHNRIFHFQHQFPFSVLFLKEAIDRFKEVKRVFEVHAVSKILNSCQTNLDNDTRSKGTRDVINIESDDEEVNNISAQSIHGSISVSSAPLIHSETIGFDPRQKRVRNSFGTPSVTIRQEPPAKRRRIWPVDVYRRFQYVVNTLGGPTVATPKEIKDHMQVAEVTEDEIINHLMKYRLDMSRRPHGHSPLFLHDTHSMVGQAVVKTSGNRIQQTPLRIGESSNGQMAAAGSNTNGGWNLICSVHGTYSAPTQDVLKMRGMPVQSGYPQTPLYAGESSNRQMMAAAPHNGNGGGKLVGEPCIHANRSMNYRM